MGTSFFAVVRRYYFWLSGVVFVKRICIRDWYRRNSLPVSESGN